MGFGVEKVLGIGDGFDYGWGAEMNVVLLDLARVCLVIGILVTVFHIDQMPSKF